jgi:hypothetical protein
MELQERIYVSFPVFLSQTVEVCEPWVRKQTWL